MEIFVSWITIFQKHSNTQSSLTVARALWTRWIGHESILKRKQPRATKIKYLWWSLEDSSQIPPWKGPWKLYAWTQTRELTLKPLAEWAQWGRGQPGMWACIPEIPRGGVVGQIPCCPACTHKHIVKHNQSHPHTLTHTHTHTNPDTHTQAHSHSQTHSQLIDTHTCTPTH